MEREWSELTDAERAAFAAWHAERSKPPVVMYRDMTPEQRLAFARQNGLPTRFDPKTRSQVPA